jgi:glutathione S-transferase
MQNLDLHFKEVNPMRRVPAIKDTDNGLTLGESPAIMAYLARKYKKYEQFRPDNEIVHARIEEYLHYHHGNTRKCSLFLYSLLFSKLYPAQLAIIPDEKVMQAEVEGILSFLDSNYFKDSEFMIGNSLTAADLLAYF